MRVMNLRAGDSFLHVSAGGGGYGDPALRDSEAVLADVIAGKVSVEAALRDYNVRIDPSRLSPGSQIPSNKSVRDAPHMEDVT
jgi:N-methylhydantoinase B/oxoprolinase/acetone carboxylase alpha subunit